MIVKCARTLRAKIFIEKHVFILNVYLLSRIFMKLERTINEMCRTEKHQRTSRNHYKIGSMETFFRRHDKIESAFTFHHKTS